MPLFVTKSVGTDPGRFEIATASGVVAVDIRRHPRARNYTLRVAGPARPAVLTMPQRGSLAEARRFLDRHAGWLKRQLDRLPAPVAIADGAVIPVRGEPHVVRHTPGARGTVARGADGADAALVVSGEAAHLRRRVMDYLKREARRDLDVAVSHHATALGVRAKAVKLRDQTSRWGSCSVSGHLAFSWRLIMAPPFVLDYLAAHEVAHLVELNHSRRFWRLVASICPEWQRARAWLNAEGAALHAIGAE